MRPPALLLAAALPATFCRPLGPAAGPLGAAATGRRAAATCRRPDVAAFVPLPSPRPRALEGALASLGPLLQKTVDPRFPAPTDAPAAGVWRLDYRGEELVTFAAGDKDPRVKGGLPDENTIFRIGSVSKVFPVLMAYQLYDRGIVKSLDDPLSAYMPHLHIPDVFTRARRQLTLRELAGQISGLPREAPCDWSLLYCNISTKEVLARLDATPGMQGPEYGIPSYSNLAYALLGNVLAEYVGMDFREYTARHILEPLGMKDTGFVFTPEIDGRMAKAYANATRIPSIDIGFVAPAGQMYSTVSDLLKLGRYFLGVVAPTLFDDGLRRALLAPGTALGDGVFTIGEPWEGEYLTDARWLTLAKGGNIDGYSAVMGVVPALNMSYAGLWTGQIVGNDFAAEALETILPSFLAALELQRPPPGLPRDPARFVGGYVQAPLEQAVRAASRRRPDLGQGQLGVANVTLRALPGGTQGLHIQLGSIENWLDFRSDSTATLSARGTPYPSSCLFEMGSGLRGAWVTFAFEADGSVRSLELPGMAYGQPYVHQASSSGTEAPTVAVV